MNNKYKELIKFIHKETIENFQYNTYGFQDEYLKNDNINYGYIPFVNTLKPKFIDAILPDIYKTNRNCRIRKHTDFICIHDTLNPSPRADVKMHNRWITNMATDPNNHNTVSWHYIVGENDIYQHIPLNEIAHHGGDGLRHKLIYKKTNIKATNNKPVFSISNDGFYEINNQKTDILAPLDQDGNIPTNDKIPYNGIHYIINKDGNYSLGNTWWSNAYNRIGNFGGNLNSIGIETCVNLGCDYNTVMRNTAKLVAELLIKYNLEVDKVKQHNDFSGKDCPMTLRKSKRWEEFIELVVLEKYFQENFSDVSVEFISLSPEYLDNYGRVIKYEENKEVSYKIIFKENNDIKEYILKSKLGICNF